MKVTIEISDRELMDIDAAVQGRVLELQERTRQSNESMAEMIKQGKPQAARATVQERALYQEEIKSIQNFVERLYAAVNNAHMKS